MRLRSCVRPICAARAAGPDGFRDPTPKRMRDLAGRHPTPVVPIVGPTDQHLFRRALAPAADERSSGGRPGPVGRPARHHGPHDAGRLVRQSHRRANFPSLAGIHLTLPAERAGPLPLPPEGRRGTFARPAANAAFGSGDTGNTRSATTGTTPLISTTFAGCIRPAGPTAATSRQKVGERQ